MNISTKISAALAVAAISAAFMGYSTSANAAGSLLATCKGASRGVVVKCCQTWVNKHGKPIWMGENDSCSSAAACGNSRGQVKALIAYVKSPYCYLETTPPESKGDKSPTKRAT